MLPREFVLLEDTSRKVHCNTVRLRVDSELCMFMSTQQHRNTQCIYFHLYFLCSGFRCSDFGG